MRHFIAVLVAAAVTGACLTGRELQYAPGVVSHVVEGQRRDLAALVATMEQVAPYTPRVDLVIPGRRANYRLAEQRPTFLVTPPFDDVIMIRLRPGEQKDDRNFRIKLQSNGGVSIAADDMVEMATTPEPSGLVRVMPSAPLRPGEYAILSRTNIKKVLPRVKMFEFGVD
jgi:hypothetical protein